MAMLSIPARILRRSLRIILNIYNQLFIRYIYQNTLAVCGELRTRSDFISPVFRRVVTLRHANRKNAMTSTAIVTVLGEDRPGLVAAITRCLWELGANLTDTSFSVLGAGADFSAVCELPTGLGVEEVAAALQGTTELAEVEISVRTYLYDSLHGPEGDVTHRIEVSGGDQPGLVARLCETFVEFKANIVSLNAGPLARDHDRYVIRLSVWLPDAAADACIATVTNTAQALGLSCVAERI
jgi:glycine cleavage system transcriptional repressor